MKANLFAFGILFACVCTLSFADEPTDIKNVLTGLVASTGSTTISVDNINNCGFPSIAVTLKSGITDLISEAAGCDPSKSSDIQAKLAALLSSIPVSVTTCLSSSADAQTLLTQLHVAGLNQTQIQTQVTNWITNNPLTACWDLQGLQSDISGGNWQQFGSDAGALIISIFTSKQKLGVYKEHFTQMLTGIASNIQQSVDVNSLVGCSDEPTYTNVEALLLPIVDEAASCDPTKLDDITKKAAALVSAIPDTSKQCFSQSPESKKLADGFGITGLTPQDIQTKVTNYILSHALTLCSTVGSLNAKLKAGDFQGFGTDSGKIVADIFKSSSNKKIAKDVTLALMVTKLKSKLGAVDTLATLLGGLASVTTAKGADVKTSVKCTDEPTATTVLSTLSDLIDEGSSCDLTKAAAIGQKAKALVDSIPSTQKQCFNQDPAAKQIATAFGIAGKPFTDLVSKVITYALGHFSDVCNTVKVLNSDVKAGNWNQFGVDSGKLILAIFSSKMLEEESAEFAALRAVDTLTDLLGGLASVTTAKGADVKTTVKCTDEPTATNVLSTLSALIGQASTCDLSKAAEIGQKAKALVDSIPDTQKQCFNQDAAAKQISTAFGIAGKPISDLVSKVMTYAIGHFAEVCNTLKVLNSDVTGAKWNQFGVDSGKLVLAIFTNQFVEDEDFDFGY